MRKLLIAASAIIGCALVFAGNIDVNRAPNSSGLTNLFELTTSKAYAATRCETQDSESKWR